LYFNQLYILDFFLGSYLELQGDDFPYVNYYFIKLMQVRITGSNFVQALHSVSPISFLVVIHKFVLVDLPFVIINSESAVKYSKMVYNVSMVNLTF